MVTRTGAPAAGASTPTSSTPGFKAQTRPPPAAASSCGSSNDAPTEVIPVIEVEILALIVDLDALGADVRTVQRDPNGVCRFSGLPNDVAIYDGDDYADECRECAPAAVEAATSDAVVVEIATGPEATL